MRRGRRRGWVAGHHSGQEDTSFEDERVAVRGSGEPVEESFECVELVEFVGWPVRFGGEFAKIEVGGSAGG